MGQMFGQINQNMSLKMIKLKQRKDWLYVITIGWTFHRKILCFFLTHLKPVQVSSKVLRFINQRLEN